MVKNQRVKGQVHHPAPYHRVKSQENDRGLLSLAFKSSLFGLTVWALAGALLVFAATAVAFAAPDPLALVPPFSIAAALISAFAGGFATEKKAKEAPLVCGLILGLLSAVVSMAAAFILKNLPSSNYAFWQSALLHAATVFFSVLGAFAANAKRKMKTKRRFG